jgi:hypothetical protein
MIGSDGQLPEGWSKRLGPELEHLPDDMEIDRGEIEILNYMDGALQDEPFSPSPERMISVGNFLRRPSVAIGATVLGISVIAFGIANDQMRTPEVPRDPAAEAALLVYKNPFTIFRISFSSARIASRRAIVLSGIGELSHVAE